MLDAKPDTLSLLAKPVQEALRERGFTTLTEAQEKAIPHILEGKHLLLISPTASGKTEAAMLPVLSTYMSNRDGPPGIKILYITPLRALNRDMLERLEWWGGRLDVKVAVRHGDTEVSERGRQAKSPPDMLITTPETLQAIFPGRILRRHLQAVRWVIIDEVHELAEDKRGSQLAIALERLVRLAGHEFQRIGLSATIGSPDEVAAFLGGNGREVTVAQVPVARKMRFKILYPMPEPSDYELAARLFTHPDVASRLRIMRDLIQGHSSVLLFTNTRSIAEVLASRFKVWDIDFPISIHHGSLAKPARVHAERGLKGGELKGLVATSSLELGIDVGRIDFVIQYMSPRQVTRLIQRVGRSGHAIGRLADGTIIAMDSDDTLEAMVIARRAYNEDLEKVSIPKQPYDALTHQIAGLLIQNRRWYFDEILELVRKAHPYRDLTEKDLLSVLTYMHSRFPRLAWMSEADRVVLRPQQIKELYGYYYDKLSMIPDERQYLVVDQTSESAIGVLDEAFVAEYAQPGAKFIVRGSPWRIHSLRGDKIFVSPTKDPTGAIPSWVGEEIPVPFEIAREVGRIRRRVGEELGKGVREGMVTEEIAEEYPTDATAVKMALVETFQQVKQGQPVPSDRLITLEEWEDFVIIGAHFGTLVNRTLARLVGYILTEETGHSAGIQQDAYRIMIQTGGYASPRLVKQVLTSLSTSDVHDLAVKASLKTGLFKRRMIHVARRFGAIGRKVDLTSVRLQQLMKTFEGTAIMEESIKETLEKDLDILGTEAVLKEIADGQIKLVECETSDSPTPISRIGVQKFSRRTDLIPADKMKQILIESAKARILNEARTLACMACRNYVEIKTMKDIEKRPKCPLCNSKRLAVLSLTDDETKKLLAKQARNLTEREEEILEKAEETAKLVAKYGLAAVYVFAGRKIEPEDANDVLASTSRIGDRLFDKILEAEREVLKRRFW